MTDTEAYEAMIGWVATHTGLTTIKSHQDADRPAKPYIMANLTTTREVRENPICMTFTESEGDVSAGVGSETEWQLSLHCYGDEPIAPLRKLKNLYRIPGIQESIHPLSIHDAGPVNRVPDLVKNEWEDRAQCNFFVRGIASDSAEIDVIEEAEITVSTT